MHIDLISNNNSYKWIQKTGKADLENLTKIMKI